MLATTLTPERKLAVDFYQHDRRPQGTAEKSAHPGGQQCTTDGRVKGERVRGSLTLLPLVKS